MRRRFTPNPHDDNGRVGPMRRALQSLSQRPKRATRRARIPVRMRRNVPNPGAPGPARWTSRAHTPQKPELASPVVARKCMGKHGGLPGASRRAMYFPRHSSDS
jgi:hypothetical protein